MVPRASSTSSSAQPNCDAEGRGRERALAADAPPAPAARAHLARKLLALGHEIAEPVRAEAAVDALQSLQRLRAVADHHVKAAVHEFARQQRVLLDRGARLLHDPVRERNEQRQIVLLLDAAPAAKRG
jgi:hypothetical protein